MQVSKFKEKEETLKEESQNEGNKNKILTFTGITLLPFPFFFSTYMMVF